VNGQTARNPGQPGEKGIGNMELKDYIYFDHSATTPLDPRVREAMAPFLDQHFGNPSSLHTPGRVAREAVECARGQVAHLLGAQPNEIVFTASGTEANNLALTGVAEAIGFHDCHFVVSAIEHPAVLETCRYLQDRGIEITTVLPDADGVVAAEAVASALRAETRLVSVMAANNVTGVVQPIEAIADAAHNGGAWFHTDAVQAVGKRSFNLAQQPIDLLSLSSHKIHGPKGVGALYIRQGIPLQPVIHGGGQERGLRSGTENVASLVGLGRAAELAALEMPEETTRLRGLRDRIIQFTRERVPGAYLVGHATQRLPGHVCLGFAGLEPKAIQVLLALDEAGIAASSGSACSSNHAGEPSSVLRAMGFDPIRARGSLRITLGRGNTEAEVERFLDVLASIVSDLRKGSMDSRS